MPAKQSGADDGYMMHTVLGRGYELNDPEILIWGFMEIHFSVKNMQKPHPAEVVSGAMQLVCVADSTLLQSTLLPGTEFLRPRANLYVRVAETCLAFYARCQSSDVTTQHEVWSKVKRNKRYDPCCGQMARITPRISSSSTSPGIYRVLQTARRCSSGPEPVSSRPVTVTTTGTPTTTARTTAMAARIGGRGV